MKEKDDAEEQFFRVGRWILDQVNDPDAKWHQSSIKLSRDIQVIMNYFMYFLLTEKSELGDNEFSERLEDIQKSVILIMEKQYNLGAIQICTIVEGIVRKSLFNDGCVDNTAPYPNWIGNFHAHPKPTTFHQFIEGALRDPRSRIGRFASYPPDPDIYHVDEMIRDHLAHGSQTLGILDDYKVLFFILILLYHDLVNPHKFPGDLKYYEWVYRKSRNIRLSGKESTLELLIEMAKDKGLDLAKVETSYKEIKARSDP